MKLEVIENIVTDLAKVRVRNMRSRKGNDVPNQFIIKGNNWELFQSYKSPIALKVYDNRVMSTLEAIILFKDWDFSRTTGKYRNIFLGESKVETEKKLESGEYLLYEEMKETQ